MLAATQGVTLAQLPVLSFVAVHLAAAAAVLGASWLVRAAFGRREMPLMVQLGLLLVGCAVVLGLAFGRLVAELQTGATVGDFGASAAALLVSAVCILLLLKTVSTAKP